MKEKFQKIGNSKGFTFLEIIIVITIISLLVAIAIPNFTRAKERTEVITSYHLENGEVVQCDYIDNFRGGVNLTSCKDGNEYMAQQNVTVTKKRKKNYE